MEKSRKTPMVLNLPADFVRNIRQSYEAAGEKWLAELPDLLVQAARGWDLNLGEPFLLSYNYVCAARRKDGTEAVFKIGVPNRELTSEINTLRVYNGRGACRLLEADAEKGMLLLERLHPGSMLATLKDDDRATEIAADVMNKIHRPVPPGDFISLIGWFDKLKGVRTLFGGGTGPFPVKSFETAEGLIRDLFAENLPQVLLHGDFHHFNILSSGRGWLVIDPKGVAGPAEYEVGPLLINNPYNVIPEEQEAIQRTERRIAILSERLGFDRQRLRAWAICHSVLSSFWDMAGDGSGGESARAWTEIFLKTRL